MCYISVGDFMKKLLQKFGIVTDNYKLYEQAFLHTSYSYEHNLGYSYETLEFLGDTIVDLVVSDYLYNSKDYNEGEMTKIRASYVCENALYEYANDLGFSDYIKVGKGEAQNGGAHKKAILADVFEAFIAAVYLDKGYEYTKKLALDIIVPYIENKNIILFSDYKSVLQEAVQTMQKSLHYELIGESGPAHAKSFEVAVKIDDIVYGRGIGGTKKEAEQEAARAALSILAKE